MLDILLYSHLVLDETCASLKLHIHIHYILLELLDLLYGSYQTMDHFG